MRKARAIGLEALLVAALGLVLALGANALSPRGLRLARNYFPELGPATTPAGGTVSSNVNVRLAGGSAPASNSIPAQETDSAARRLQQRGLQTVSSNEVIELFRDPRREQGLVVFVDARNESHYTEGHIPGAWLFDHYRAENYLPTILPACLTALKVVIYCSGGECEDSAFAAVVLRDAGVPREVLFVYTGGITEWRSHGMPEEKGARGGGAPQANP